MAEHRQPVPCDGLRPPSAQARMPVRKIRECSCGSAESMRNAGRRSGRRAALAEARLKGDDRAVVDEAPCQMMAAGDVVELIAEVAVAEMLCIKRKCELQEQFGCAKDQGKPHGCTQIRVTRSDDCCSGLGVGTGLRCRLLLFETSEDLHLLRLIAWRTGSTNRSGQVSDRSVRIWIGPLAALSDDIEDRRGSGGGGGWWRDPEGIGIVGFIVLLVISLITGRNYLGSFLSGGARARILQTATTKAPGPPAYRVGPAGQDSRTHLCAGDRSAVLPMGRSVDAQLISFVLGVMIAKDARTVQAPFLEQPRWENYRPREDSVLFTSYTRSGCGMAQSGQRADFIVRRMRRSTSTSAFGTSYTASAEARRTSRRPTWLRMSVAIMCRIFSASSRRYSSSPRRGHLERNPLSVALELQAVCLRGYLGA